MKVRKTAIYRYTSAATGRPDRSATAGDSTVGEGGSLISWMGIVL